jgi:hypothetical protein
MQQLPASTWNVISAVLAGAAHLTAGAVQPVPKVPTHGLVIWFSKFPDLSYASNRSLASLLLQVSEGSLGHWFEQRPPSVFTCALASMV